MTATGKPWSEVRRESCEVSRARRGDVAHKRLVPKKRKTGLLSETKKLIEAKRQKKKEENNDRKFPIDIEGLTQEQAVNKLIRVRILDIAASLYHSQPYIQEVYDEKDDFIQDAMLNLLEFQQVYNPQKGVTLEKFLVSALYKWSSIKWITSSKQNTYVSRYISVDVETLFTTHADDRDNVDRWVDQLYIDDILNDPILTKMQKKRLHEYFSGRTIREIAADKGCSYHAVYGCIQLGLRNLREKYNNREET